MQEEAITFFQYSSCQEKYLREVSLQYNDLRQMREVIFLSSKEKQLIMAGIGN